MARKVTLPSGLERYQATTGSGKDRKRTNFLTMGEAEAWEASKAPPAPPQAPQATTLAKPTIGGSTWTLQTAYDKTFAARWKGKSSARTCRANWSAISAFFGADTLCEKVVQGTWIQEFRTYQRDVKGNGPSAVNGKIINLSTMLKYCQEYGGLSRVPKFLLFKTTQRERWFTEAEETLILDKCIALGYLDLHAFVILALDLGFRRGELLPLTLASYHDGVFLLQADETKGQQARAVVCTPRLRELVQRRIAEGQMKLCGRLTVSIIEDQWNAVQDALGMGHDESFTPHTLRHTYATRLIAAGVPLRVVQQVLGHKDPKTTMRYTHVSNEQVRDAADALQRYNDSRRIPSATPPKTDGTRAL